jgi:hypothetical protein
LSASGFGLADLVTHKALIAPAPFEALSSMTLDPSSYLRISCSKKNSIDFFVATRRIFSRSQHALKTIQKTIQNEFFVVTRHFFGATVAHDDHNALKTIESRHTMDARSTSRISTRAAAQLAGRTPTELKFEMTVQIRLASK